MSKGSHPRPFTDRQQYEANFDAIFGKRQSPEKTDTTETDSTEESDNGQ